MLLRSYPLIPFSRLCLLFISACKPSSEGLVCACISCNSFGVAWRSHADMAERHWSAVDEAGDSFAFDCLQWLRMDIMAWNMIRHVARVTG
ncbi:hypothetical protein EV126DRAFT_204302 [Verticillium dahliae]|nr:hypothetical protein EV126DRAFT_204302 [Verticillium dahliae]